MQSGDYEPLRPWRKLFVARLSTGQRDVYVAKIGVFMNLAGEAVSPFLSYFKIAPEETLVVHDDLDFEPGTVKFKRGGGHGGHNGLRSLISFVGRDFTRLRLGVGKPPDPRRGADHVLSRFAPDARVCVDEALDVGVEAVELYLSRGLDFAMNRINSVA